MRPGKGCLICRGRKIKCDETAGGCNNCKRKKLVCDYITFADGSGLLLTPFHLDSTRTDASWIMKLSIPYLPTSRLPRIHVTPHVESVDSHDANARGRVRSVLGARQRG